MKSKKEVKSRKGKKITLKKINKSEEEQLKPKIVFDL